MLCVFIIINFIVVEHETPEAKYLCAAAAADATTFYRALKSVGRRGKSYKLRNSIYISMKHRR